MPASFIGVSPAGDGFHSQRLTTFYNVGHSHSQLKKKELETNLRRKGNLEAQLVHYSPQKMVQAGEERERKGD